MDKRLDAQLQNFAAHEIGGHSRRAARIVRERERGNVSARRRLRGLGQSPVLRRFPRAPARHQFPGDRKQGWILQCRSETIFPHRPPRFFAQKIARRRKLVNLF
jgi:hypothetical protein